MGEPLTDPDVRTALVREAMKGSAVSWITVPGSSPKVAWHVWASDAAYVLHARDDRLAESSEQPVPGLGDASTVTVTARGATWGRVVTWAATVSHLEPGSPQWDTALGLLRGARLNDPDPSSTPQRWAHSAGIAMLHPSGELLEGPGDYDESRQAAVPAPSPATTLPDKA